MPDSFGRRRRLLARQLKPLGVDGLVVSNPVNVMYLTGFTGGASYLLLSSTKTLLVSDHRFTEQLAEEAPGLAVHFRPPTRTTLPEVAAVLAQLGWTNVGFEASHLTIAALEILRAQAKSASFRPTTGLVEAMRAAKDAGEIRYIREAVAVAERTFAMLRATLHGDMTERDLCDAIEAFVRRAGGTGTSFEPIAAVGKRSALAHAPPTDRTVASSDFVLIDWGARKGNYVSDLTRMLVTRKSWFRPHRGRPDDPRLAKVYRAVLTAHERSAAMLRPGVKARDVDAAARAALADAGFGEHFTHGLGHGIGLEVHEAPDLRASSEQVLESGMVVTIEPGAYFRGWGGVRIEDDYLVTPSGCERLSTLPLDFAGTEIP
ncbi:MAG: Xaa-Pro peptidase family protein [Gemmataceae bacterium]